MASWVVVVPVKPLATAKSRLVRGAGAGAGADRRRLALCFAQDTVSAALACDAVAEVLVVTGDATVAKALAELGAHVVPDKPDAGLNTAVSYGADLAGHHPVAALAADLPALRPTDLTGALADAQDGAPAGAPDGALAAATRPIGRAFVPDAPGTGTVLLAAAAGVPLDPRFGPGSAAAHEASGAVRLVGAWPSLRRDVDTAADLAEAAELGLGRYTAALLR